MFEPVNEYLDLFLTFLAIVFGPILLAGGILYFFFIVFDFKGYMRDHREIMRRRLNNEKGEDNFYE